MLFFAENTYKCIKVSIIGEKSNIGLIELNRPKALNALSDSLMNEVIRTLRTFDADPAITCTIITGSSKTFSGLNIHTHTCVYLLNYVTRDACRLDDNFMFLLHPGES